MNPHERALAKLAEMEKRAREYPGVWVVETLVLENGPHGLRRKWVMAGRVFYRDRTVAETVVRHPDSRRWRVSRYVRATR